MNKLLILDKNNKILISMDKTCPETWEDIIVNNSVEIIDNEEWMVIRLKEDYSTYWTMKAEIIDWEISYNSWL